MRPLLGGAEFGEKAIAPSGEGSYSLRAFSGFDPKAITIGYFDGVDVTGCPKKGRESVGVARQYCG